MAYWRWTSFRQGKLKNGHYQFFFTEYFGLPVAYYNRKVVLDLGCGPRGSLEWAHNVKRRIGLDPLANAYKRFGTEKHQMEYVHSEAERMPFPDESVDVISSFNSLDHVRDVTAALAEIRRVLKPGGDFLLVVDIHRLPTLTEPQTLSWDFLETHFPDWKIVSERQLARVYPTRIWQNLRRSLPAKKGSANGVLVAHLIKPH